MHSFRSAGPISLLAETWYAGASLAQAHARRHADWQRHGLRWMEFPAPQRLAPALGALRDGVAGALALPFDMVRLQHAAAVRAGLWPRSLLESQHFERQLDTLEHLVLGPLARSV